MPYNKKGTIYWTAQWRDEKGKLKTKTFGDGTNEENKTNAYVFEDEQKRLYGAVREKRKDVKKAQKEAGISVEDVGKKTLKDAWELWVVIAQNKKTTFDSDVSIYHNHLKEFFGENILLENINVKLIEEFKTHQLNKDKIPGKFRNVEGKIGKGTINKHLVLLNSMLNACVDAEMLDAKPRVKIFKYQVKQKDILRSYDEIENFLSCVEYVSKKTYTRAVINENARPKHKHRKIKEPLSYVHTWFKVYVNIFLFTGMRNAEIWGLEWKDIDFENEIILVRHKPEKGKKVKTGLDRDVPIKPRLLEILKWWQKETGGKSWLFVNTRGQKRKNNDMTFRRLWAETIEMCEFEDKENFTPYSLRHTFATWEMNQNSNAIKLSITMGHQDVQTSMNYAKRILKVDDKKRFGDK